MYSFDTLTRASVLADAETLGSRLLRARLAYGARVGRVVTQLEVAKDLSVSGVAVGGWEADRNEPGLDNLRAIARFYGVRLGWLLEGELPMWSGGENQGTQPAELPPTKPKEPPAPPAVTRHVRRENLGSLDAPTARSVPKGKRGRTAMAG